MLAEIQEYTGLTHLVNEVNDHQDIPYWIRQKIESVIRRRAYPGTPYKKLSQIKNFAGKDRVEHVDISWLEKPTVIHNYYKPSEEY